MQQIKDALNRKDVTVGEIRRLLEKEISDSNDDYYTVETPNIIDFDITLEARKKILSIAIQANDDIVEYLRELYELGDDTGLSVKLILKTDRRLLFIDELFIWELLLQIEADLNYLGIDPDYYLQLRLDLARRTRISSYGESKSEKEDRELWELGVKLLTVLREIFCRTGRE